LPAAKVFCMVTPMQTIICKACSNGCNLSIERLDEATLVVDKNFCPKGVGYAFSKLSKTEKGKFIPANPDSPYSKDDLAAIFRLWNKELKKVSAGTFIQGSPERSLYRSVIEDINENLFILEQVPPNDITNKKRIAKDIAAFAAAGLPVTPYITDEKGERILEHQEAFWQLIPYIKGVALDRKKYWQEGWRGKAVAQFLVQLKELGKNNRAGEKSFSIIDFIQDISAKIKIDKPELFLELTPILEHLKKNLFPVYDSVPLAFCHGDAHPLNMLWSESKILSVIDWEFFGLKPVLYDTALIIGCVGIEAPSARNGDFIKAFKQQLIEQKIFSEKTWELLPLFVLAQRFAWLSEWLRRDDEEMLEHEVDYMNNLLLES
jgi:homoserine kinase type II